MKKAFRKSLKRQASLGYFSNNFKNAVNSSHQEPEQVPILWQALSKKYQFNYPQDWYRIEAHWLDQIESFQEQPIDCPGRDIRMNNAITRITQCNESFQLCNSLPRSFIVPKDLRDFTLTNTMSTIIKDHRVPVISYCCPIEYRRNFILRCASSDQQFRVIDILSKIVKPLKVYNLSSLAPSREAVNHAHKKLRDVCRPGEDQASNFIAKSGKWLNIVSQALKLARNTANTLMKEASVLLIEDDDRGWNNVVSSLVQLLLEPHCRTVEGLESLISKEWIYLSGGHLNHGKPDPLFILFLDCIYQIYLQNVVKFEFTSEYLKYLFESQYVVAHTSSLAPIRTGQSLNINHNQNNINNNNNSRTTGLLVKKQSLEADSENETQFGYEIATYKPSSMTMVDLNFTVNNNNNHNHNNTIATSVNLQDKVQKFESGYRIFMFNPFYDLDNDSPTVEVYDHIANMKLWLSLYLSWQPKTNYGCVEEAFYFHLLNST